LSSPFFPFLNLFISFWIPLSSYFTISFSLFFILSPPHFTCPVPTPNLSLSLSYPLYS
jgi:hypothetical protein